MKIKVSEASGPALDWMVAKCEGGFDLHRRMDWHNKPWAFFFRDDEDPERVDKFYLSEYEPSTDWAQGGPIISRERISIRHWTNVPIVHAYMPDSDWSSDGESALVAAMRAYVGSKLGNEVEVPDELGGAA